MHIPDMPCLDNPITLLSHLTVASLTSHLLRPHNSSGRLHLTGPCFSSTNQPNQSPQPQHLPYSASTFQATVHQLQSPRAGTRQLGAAPMLQSHEIIQLADAKPAHPPCPILPAKTTVKTLAQSSPPPASDPSNS